MRPIMRTMTTVLALSFAAVALTPAPVLAASKGMRAKMMEMKAKDPQSYAACESLARQRGYSIADLGNSVMMFIEGCMMAKSR
jgi:hypothetical protein